MLRRERCARTQIDLEVLDAALGGVREEAPEVVVPEPLVVNDEGDAVEAATRAALQQAEHLSQACRRGGGGCRGRMSVPPIGSSRGRATPAGAPPCGWHP